MERKEQLELLYLLIRGIEKKHIVLNPRYGEVDPEYPDQWRATILRELQEMFEAIEQGPDYNMMDIHIRQESEKRIYEAARKVALILAEVNATYEEVNLILMTSKDFLTVTSSSEAPKYHLD